jgi:hypothetical protein
MNVQGKHLVVLKVATLGEQLDSKSGRDEDGKGNRKGASVSRSRNIDVHLSGFGGNADARAQPFPNSKPAKQAYASTQRTNNMLAGPLFWVTPAGA